MRLSLTATVSSSARRAFAWAALAAALVAAMTTAGDILRLIARRASGVVRGEQLAGTAAQYRLETHLLDIGVDPRRVTLAPVPAEDVVAVWEPYGYAVSHGDGAAGSVGIGN